MTLKINALSLKGLLPYQKQWLQDQTQIKIWEKSRQVGATWTQSLEDVLDCKFEQVQKVYFSSANEEAGKEYIEYCEEWARRINLAISEITEEKLEDDERTTYQMFFKNNSTISALSSNPRRMRGKRGKIVLDEFAHHDDQRSLWKAARPAAAWGFPVRLISTHNSKSSLFYRFLKDVKKGELKWYLQRTDIFDAVNQGLVNRIYKRRTNAKERKNWIEKERRDCASADIWAEEYCCEPSDELSAFLPYQLIVSCEEDNVEKPLANMPNGDLYVGVDVGRKKDLTVIWVCEKVGNVYFTRAIIPLEKTKFADQKVTLFSILKKSNVHRCCIDATGLGMQLAEEMQDAFGAYRVEAVTFAARVKEELAYPMLATMEERNLRIPQDQDVRDDLHSLRRVVSAAGNVRFDVDASAKSHADRFWACALALHAGRSGTSELYIKSSKFNRQLNGVYNRFNGGKFAGY